MAQSRTNDVVPQRRLGLVILAVAIAMVLAMLDNLIVGTAMPTIVAQLGGLKYLSWVVTTYALTTAATTPLWGKLGDMYGRKGMFLTSIALFLAGSALSGMSQTMNELIGFRALQGAGAGGLMVGAFTIMGVVIPSRQRGKYQGMMSAIMGAAMVSGPLIGGVITDHIGWRWGFYVNLPIGALAVLLIVFGLRLPPRKGSTARIDFAGALLLTAAISAIVLMTSWGGSRYTWGSGQIIGLGILIVALVGAFLVVEGRAASPVLPLRIFRDRNFSLVTLIGFLVSFTLYGVMTFLPIYQQTVKGDTATGSGLQLLPVIIGQVAVNVLAGAVITKTGRYKVFVILGGILLVPALFLLAQLGTGTSRPLASLYMAVFGAGMGFLMQTTMLIALDSTDMKDRGVASSTATLARTVGGALGVSVMGAVFSDRIRQMAAGHGAAASAATGNATTQLNAASLAKLPHAARALLQDATASGIHQTFLLATVIGAVSLFAAWFINEVPLRGTPAPKPGKQLHAEADSTSST